MRKQRHYSKRQKAEVLRRLAENNDNLSLTSIQTGIPRRTLSDWRHTQRLLAFKESEQDLDRVNPPETQPLSIDEDLPEGEYARIRHQVIQHINSLLASLTDDPDTAHLRVNALSRLLDRAVKLDALTAKEGSSVVRLEFKYPDGTIHDIPPWRNPDFEFIPPKQVSLYDAPEDDLPRWRPQRPESTFNSPEPPLNLSPEEDQAALREYDDATHWNSDPAPLQPDVPEVVPPSPESQEEPPRPLTREEYKEYLREQEKDFAWGRSSLIQYQDSE